MQKKPVVKNFDHLFRCARCGKEYENPTGKFFKNKWSERFKANEEFTDLCINCVNELLETYSRRYKDEKTAAIILCGFLDLPFYHSVYDNIIEQHTHFQMGRYVRVVVNNTQYADSTFFNTYLSGELDKPEEVVKAEKEKRWTAEEKRNMNETILAFGYDPFEDFSSSDRRFLFNEIVKYFDDSTTEDTFKLSQVRQLVINDNQIRGYDILISNLDPAKDGDQIKKLTALKSQVASVSSTIAKENAISMKNRTDVSAGKSTLSGLMKEMREKDLDGIQENYYNVLKSDGTLWAAEMSMQALKKHAMFQDHEVVDMINEQREYVQTLEKKVNDLEEEKRLLRVKVNDLESNNGS